MTSTLTLAAVIFVCLATTACGQSDQAFGDRVRAYLLSHPEVIQQAEAKLQEKQQAQAAADARSAIDKNRKALERDPRDFVANPNGSITVTEFYDYRCPHCINVAPNMLALIHSDPDVRVVFKELPIFGGPSDTAAAGAVAVKQAGGDSLSLYHDFMTARPLDEAAVDRILKAHGVDPAGLVLPKFKEALDQQLGDVRQLAGALGIEGTPAFVIGDTMVPGEDMDAVKAAIQTQRGGKG